MESPVDSAEPALRFDIVRPAASCASHNHFPGGLTFPEGGLDNCLFSAEPSTVALQQQRSPLGLGLLSSTRSSAVAKSPLPTARCRAVLVILGQGRRRVPHRANSVMTYAVPPEAFPSNTTHHVHYITVISPHAGRCLVHPGLGGQTTVRQFT